MADDVLWYMYCTQCGKDGPSRDEWGDAMEDAARHPKDCANSVGIGSRRRVAS